MTDPTPPVGLGVEPDVPPILPPVDVAEVHTDTWVVRFVVLGLMLITLAVVIGAIYLANVDKSLPEAVVVLGSASGGALAGVLASTTSRKQ